jgi:TolB-like protein/DNA-binding winged helix-turn-helix (wHTH) protein/tetratricopeptide (TPR) repeat protein
VDVPVTNRGCYCFGPFHLDTQRRALLRDGVRLKLAERLIDTLFYLVANNGRIVEREELGRAVWGTRTVEDNNIAQAISTLRKVLQADGGTETFIVTVPGRGYRFAAPFTFASYSRLTAGPDEAAQAAPMPAPPVSAPWWRQRAMVGGAIAALGLVALIVARHPPAARDNAQPPFTPPAHSVAVLAFDNMTGDPGQAYISDGLSEQLIDSLSRVDALQVAARTSSFSFRGKAATVGDIARALNVGTVLEGSVRRRGSHLIITAQLINALTGYHIWSNTYDRDAGDIVPVQVAIGQAVTRSLEVSLLGDGAALLTLGGTTNPAAFDAYLRGVHVQETAADAAGVRAAMTQLDAALALDPGFARAHAARAFARARLGEMGAIANPDALRQIFADALDDADRAVALAPSLAAAHSVRGVVLQWGFLDLQGDEAEQAKALELSPGSTTVERNYAEAAIALGHLDEAIAAGRRATQLDPMAPGAWTVLAHAQYMARRYDDTIDTLHHAEAVTGTMPRALSYLLGKAELMRGHPDAARRACADGKGWLQQMVLALAFHALGQQNEADRNLAAMQAELHDAGAYNYAVIYAQWGQREDALRWLQTAWRLRDPGLADIKVNPMLDPIRDRDGFRDIERQVLAARG